MTGSRIERLLFDEGFVRDWAETDGRHKDWPVVYLIDGEKYTDGKRYIYVGETVSAATRLRTHIKEKGASGLSAIRVIVHDEFNKSACLDLESHLIRLLSGDGFYTPINRNVGITEADYFDRDRYRDGFNQIFEELRADGLFQKSIAEIENSDLFKLSPYKALTVEQEEVIRDVLDGLLSDLRMGTGGRTVIQGDPGTGKTVVAIYLMKLLSDLKDFGALEEPGRETETALAGFQTAENAALLQDFQIALVVPQKSLRASIKEVFKRTPGLREEWVLTPFEVAEDRQQFDLVIVDETHRLNQFAAQAHGNLTKRFKETNAKFFPQKPHADQIDWIEKWSRHQIYLLDGEQSVRPQDLPSERVSELQNGPGRHFTLHSQLRVSGGADYVNYVGSILSDTPPNDAATFGSYRFELFDDLGAMIQEIRSLDAEHGLARIVAGYAWKWVSRFDRSKYDIVEDGQFLRWNSRTTDWIASENSLDEAGSIHTVQGYDLNYAGVIIGRDLRFDTVSERLFVSRDDYYDTRGKAHNTLGGQVTNDEKLLWMVTNIYRVLLTRGMKGTFVYVCDEPLREYLAQFVPANSSP